MTKNEKPAKVEQTLMLKILHEDKRDKILFFVMWIITFIALLGAVVYIIYLTNDTGSITDEITIQDVQTIDNSHIKIGDDIWEKSK